MGAQSQAIAANLTAAVEQASKALILEIAANLIATTPVKTGWARANWIPSIGAPSDATDGDPKSVSSAAQQAGTASVLRFKLGDQFLYVSNNVPYINQLNLGHSHQAPVGFIEAAVDQAAATVQAHYDGLTIDLTTSDDAGGGAAANLAEAYSPL